MNWTTILTEEARRDSVIRADRLAREHKISERRVRDALRRYEAQGLVERVSTKIYVNHFNQHFSTRDLVNTLRPRSYISLESALVEAGVINQSPSALTCVAPGYSHFFKTKSVSIVYRKISPELDWGHLEKATRYNKYRIAEPEKAFLDWVYLNRQGGLPTPLDEANLQFLDAGKLRDYAERFPGTVTAAIKELLLESVFPSHAEKVSSHSHARRQ